MRIIKGKNIPPSERVRFDVLNSMLLDSNIDVLVCRLPDNILFLTGTWPNAGLCWVLYRSRDGKCIIVNPGDETETMENSWIDGMVEYVMGDLESLTPINERVKPAIREVMDYFGDVKTIGWEQGFDLAPTCHWLGEYRCPTETDHIIKDILPEVKFVDASSILNAARRKKTPIQIEAMKRVNEIAVKGLLAAKTLIRPGIREIEVQNTVETAITSFGTGYKGASRVRAFAYVMSGPRSYQGDYSYNLTGTRIIENCDLVLIELVVCAEGYWADLSRTYVAGDITEEQKKVYSIILEAYEAAIKQLRPGVRQSDVDLASRKVIDASGYGQYNTYGVGHGVGYAYHENTCFHPAAEDIVQVGDTYTIEPGVYIPEFGGMRVEDNYLVTEDGCINLTPLDLDLV